MCRGKTQLPEEFIKSPLQTDEFQKLDTRSAGKADMIHSSSSYTFGEVGPSNPGGRGVQRAKQELEMG